VVRFSYAGADARCASYSEERIPPFGCEKDTSIRGGLAGGRAQMVAVYLLGEDLGRSAILFVATRSIFTERRFGPRAHLPALSSADAPFTSDRVAVPR
jgi:hypothetical protein